MKNYYLIYLLSYIRIFSIFILKKASSKKLEQYLESSTRLDLKFKLKSLKLPKIFLIYVTTNLLVLILMH